MPQIAAVSINDGQATPVAHVFNPVQTTPPLWKRNGASVPVVGMEGLTIITKLTKENNGINKIDVELTIPVMEQTSGGTSTGYVAPPGVAHIERFKGTFFLHQRSDKAGRKDLRVMAGNLLLNAVMAAAVDDLEQPY